MGDRAAGVEYVERAEGDVRRKRRATHDDVADAECNLIPIAQRTRVNQVRKLQMFVFLEPRVQRLQHSALPDRKRDRDALVRTRQPVVAIDDGVFTALRTDVAW